MGPPRSPARIALLGLACLALVTPVAGALPTDNPTTRDGTLGGDDEPLESQRCAGGACANVRGPAQGDDAAVSGTGDAHCPDDGCTAASATGKSSGGRAASATGDAEGHLSVSATGEASCRGGNCTAASATGDAKGHEAASATGDARGPTAVHKDTPRHAAESVLAERETGGTPDDPSWGDPEDATIRPGAPLRGDVCTTGFVLTDETTGDVLVATAAHCIQDLDVGDDVGLARGTNGTLVYDGWTTLEEADADGPCAYKWAQDLALVRVADEHRDEVHPAVLGWGGPSDLRETARSGEQVFVHGASDDREDRADSLEGVSLGNGRCLTEAVVPGVTTGDSGAPVLASDVGALGVYARAPGFAAVTNLHQAVAFAEEHADLDLELETWTRSREGLLQDPRDGPSAPPWTPDADPAVPVDVDGQTSARTASPLATATRTLASVPTR
jgi:V8-like Glu-specific endopeptidase